MSHDALRVGLLYSLTGPLSVTEASIHRGAVLAAEEINAAGGVQGRELVTVHRGLPLGHHAGHEVRGAAGAGRRGARLRRRLHVGEPDRDAPRVPAPRRGLRLQHLLRGAGERPEHGLRRRRAQPVPRRLPPLGRAGARRAPVRRRLGLRLPAHARRDHPATGADAGRRGARGPLRPARDDRLPRRDRGDRADPSRRRRLQRGGQRLGAGVLPPVPRRRPSRRPRCRSPPP